VKGPGKDGVALHWRSFDLPALRRCICNLLLACLLACVRANGVAFPVLSMVSSLTCSVGVWGNGMTVSSANVGSYMRSL
jgi:hypothetical protein